MITDLAKDYETNTYNGFTNLPYWPAADPIERGGDVRTEAPNEKLLTELGIALLAVASIHILDHLALIPQTAKSIQEGSQKVFNIELKKATKELTDDVAAAIATATTSIISDVIKETGQALQEARDSLLVSTREASLILQRQVESIKVMEDSNLISIFPSRSSAASAIRSAMADSKKVWLMGISLNEFFRADQSPFRQAWQELVKSIRDGSKEAKILLIDPYCHGAVLRSYFETANTEMVSGRLETDVLDGAYYLRQIRSELGANGSKLEVQVYQLPPSTFLCHLDTMSFVQHYHFWSQRIYGSPIPLLQYRKRGPGQAGVCIQSEMERHFNFVWDHASIPLDDFLPMPTRGLEWGSHVSGMGSVFVDRSRPNIRMRDEIERSKRIWIQGITLKAFFTDSALSAKLRERVAGTDAKSDVRIMLLDPACDQAKDRAYREFLLSSGSKISFEEFSENHYQHSKLVSDLHDTINRINRMNATFAEQGLGNSSQPLRVQARKYKTTPHMFVLIGDCSAFVEQYSYGKLGGGVPTAHREAVILGSDMPLIEYRRDIAPVYRRVIDELRIRADVEARELRPQPYHLLKNHFEYAWSQAVPI